MIWGDRSRCHFSSHHCQPCRVRAQDRRCSSRSDVNSGTAAAVMAMLQQVHMPRPLSLGCKPWRRRCPMQPRWLQRLHAPAPPLQLASGRGGAMVAKSLPASTGKPSCSRRDQWLTCNQGAGGKKPKCSAGQRVEGAGGLPNLQAAEAKLVARNCTAGSCAPMRACLVGGQEVAGPAVAPAAEGLQPLVLKDLLNHRLQQARGAHGQRAGAYRARARLLPSTGSGPAHLGTEVHAQPCAGSAAVEPRKRGSNHGCAGPCCQPGCRTAAHAPYQSLSMQIAVPPGCTWPASWGARWAGMAGRNSRCAAVGLQSGSSKAAVSRDGTSRQGLWQKLAQSD